MLNGAIRVNFEEPAHSAPAPMPERAIDLVFLAQQSLGDKGLEIELLTMFQKQAETIVARLVKPVCGGDRRWQHDLAHTLKGSARAVGAAKVARAAEDFEAALRANASEEKLAEKAKVLETVVGEARTIILSLIAEG
jgi:HPt (histidine-containing phosphotransfer) domain-containing protein